jgi:hypothetical protein
MLHKHCIILLVLISTSIMIMMLINNNRYVENFSLFSLINENTRTEHFASINNINNVDNLAPVCDVRDQYVGCNDHSLNKKKCVVHQRENGIYMNGPATKNGKCVKWNYDHLYDYNKFDYENRNDN